jgi:hypothetical protein
MIVKKFKVTQIKVTQTREVVMKKSLVVLAAMAFFIVMVGGAFAGTASPLVPAPKVVVKGTVKSACTFVSDGTITFDIDPSTSTGPITANTTDNGTAPTVMCTMSQTPSVSCAASAGSTLKLSDASDGIAYTIPICGDSSHKITGDGFLDGHAVTIPVGISILQTAYGPAKIGDHSDNITITVNF